MLFIFSLIWIRVAAERGEILVFEKTGMYQLKV